MELGIERVGINDEINQLREVCRVDQSFVPSPLLRVRVEGKEESSESVRISRGAYQSTYSLRFRSILTVQVGNRCSQ